MPVVASIAVDETTGQAYNVNADVVASQLAIELGAEKLVFINDVPGLIGPDGRPAERALGRAVPRAARARRTWSSGGMIPKLESAVRGADGRGRPGAPRRRPGRALPGARAVHARGRRHDDHARRRGRRRGAVVNEPAVMPTYARYPLTLVRGDGTARLGRRRAARTSTSPGRSASPRSATPTRRGSRPCATQLETLDMVSNLYATEPQAELAARLAGVDARARRARLLLQLRRRGQRGRDQARAQARPRDRASRRSWRSRARSTAARSRRSPRPASRRKRAAVRAARGLVPVRAARRSSPRSTPR